MNQKAAELRALAEGELREQVAAAHQELFSLRFRLSTRQFANSAELRKVRRKIARIYTLLTERKAQTLLAEEPK